MGWPNGASLRGFWSEERGNVAVIFGLVAVVLMLAIGAAVDVGRWLHARDQTLAAIDAAVLAGGRALQTTDGDQAAAVDAATKFYNTNVATRLPVLSDTVNFTVAADGMGMTANGTAFIKTPFLQFASIDKLPLISTSQTQFDGSGSQIGMAAGNTEVSVMLDVTGSMLGTKLADLKTAALDLVSVVTQANKSGKYTTKLAIVPFSEDIRLPTTTAINKARGTGLAKSKSIGSGSNKKTVYLSDCVAERTGNAKYNDDAPAANKYVLAHYTESKTGSGSNVKGVCTVPTTATVQPLTSDVTTLENKIKGLSAAGGTAGHLGTAWAWYTLSPNWNSLWATENQAAPYSALTATGTGKVSKVAILMTDGEYNVQYDTNGMQVDANKISNCQNAANKPDCSTGQADALCSAMKDKGIVVYTIGFGSGMTSTAKQLLKDCASDSTKYYTADDGSQLKQAFRDIAIKLTTIYLSK